MNKNGFTLVELSIVMIIIGLLIGGVLKGQELIGNVRLARTVKDIQSFQAGLYTFSDIYRDAPGDIRNATTLIPNCNATSSCVNGNGDQTIGTRENAAWHYNFNKTINSENVQFWKHLALADVIGGVQSHSTLLTWGEAFPATPLGGGYTVTDVSPEFAGSDTAGFFGKIIQVHNCPTACNEIEAPPAPILSPIEAQKIDVKLDDSSPFTGIVRASGVGADAADVCASRNGVQGVYNVNTVGVDKVCTLYYRLK